MESIQKPRLVNPTTIQRVLLNNEGSGVGGINMTGGQIPAPTYPSLPALPGFPKFSFFEIIIVIFIVWVIVELYRRYQKRKHKLKKKSKNLVDIIYDFVTDKRENYNENLDYL